VQLIEQILYEIHGDCSKVEVLHHLVVQLDFLGGLSDNRLIVLLVGGQLIDAYSMILQLQNTLPRMPPRMVMTRRGKSSDVRVHSPNCSFDM